MLKMIILPRRARDKHSLGKALQKEINLPRQARDKHRESTQKTGCLKIISRWDGATDELRRTMQEYFYASEDPHHAGVGWVLTPVRNTRLAFFGAILIAIAIAIETMSLPRQARDKHRKR
jgi:hypothetical protein